MNFSATGLVFILKVVRGVNIKMWFGIAKISGQAARKEKNVH